MYNFIMTFTTYTSQVRSLKNKDPRFYINDKFIRAPRAGFEISKDCPQSYKQIIAQCIDSGWLQPVANITERELIFMGLSQRA